MAKEGEVVVGYWVVHTRACSAGGETTVAGVLENLVTGTRQNFESVTEMVALISKRTPQGTES